MKQKEKGGLRNLWILTALIIPTAFILSNNIQLKFFLYKNLLKLIAFTHKNIYPIIPFLTQLTINNITTILYSIVALTATTAIIKLIRNEKVQEKTTQTYKILIPPTSRFLTKKILTIYKETSIIIKDVLSIDREVITSFLKEIKAELNITNKKLTLIIALLIIITISLYTATADYSVLPENTTTNETINNAPIIESYTPENNPSIKVNETQEFTITTSDPDEDTLSIQWYVDNLPIADQIQESFSYTSSEPGEFEIKVLVTDNKEYTTKKWTLTVSPEENITLPENITEENVTQPENITGPVNETIENITQPEITTEDDELTQLQAEINKPVQWIRKIRNKNLTQKISIKLPKQATNIKAQKITKLITEEIKEDIKPEKLLLNGKRPSKKFTTTGMVVIEVKESWIKNFFKNIFRVAGFAVAEPGLEEEIELVIEEAAAKYEISYETSAPLAEETELEAGKRITIYSDMNYENVTAYTTIREISREGINFYWVKETGREPFEATYTDTNDNGLIDRLEWVVPHLSNQTFEVELEILNVQSYPTVGGNWTVEFATNGTANLTIKAFDETTWSNVNEDNDLKFLEIRCGDEILGYTWTDDSVFIEDYNCEELGYETSKVLTPGTHTLEFQFGTETAYAHNQAGEDCSEGCWFVRNETGDNLTIVTAATGDLYLRGKGTPNIDVAALSTVGDNGGHLIFKDSSGTIVAWVNKLDNPGANSRAGDLNLIGTASLNQANCPAPVGSFVIKDSVGTTMFYIDSNGNLCIKGTYYPEAF